VSRGKINARSRQRKEKGEKKREKREKRAGDYPASTSIVGNTSKGTIKGKTVTSFSISRLEKKRRRGEGRGEVS